LAGGVAGDVVAAFDDGAGDRDGVGGLRGESAACNGDYGEGGAEVEGADREGGEDDGLVGIRDEVGSGCWGCDWGE
jgi:hypothetical protein